MTKQTWYIIGALAALAVLLIGAKVAFGQESQKEIPCMPSEDFISFLEENAGYKALILSLQDGGKMEVSIKPETREWIIVVTQDGVSCQIGVGTGYVIQERE